MTRCPCPEPGFGAMPALKPGKQQEETTLKKVWREFKQFAFRGNVLDMAVGVMIASAFGKIVTSVVNDLFMPLIGCLLGGVAFENLFVVLDGGGAHYATLQEAQEAGAAVFAYGSFLSVVVDFLIIAACIFLLLKVIAKLNFRRKEPEAVPKPRLCPYCRMEIAADATRCPHCTSQLAADAGDGMCAAAADGRAARLNAGAGAGTGD